ncbi:RNA 2',3'-cyclic phosphodiesterase [Rheinheimera sp. UJ63]|uniref:RNA 2',3'-cyclic phosphodiesterase n=1 Tax=Rheinheimera sp. UJ63 TaxID=2910157 RepID=UPI001F1D255A|nr:RNA 2',3'-cyclic phosphodiesterase [Rheinheimera sp. UJ63]MCF4009326.1 RNA 2',3'-cyclic phosphodiesterase [Rheinheimera sp. UJ63]
MKRLFFALQFSPAQQQAILTYQQQLIAQYPDARIVTADNFHLTLFFLGQVDGEQEPFLLSAAKTIAPIDITLTFDKLGYFAKPKIAYLAPSVIPEPLLQLQQQITQLCQQQGFEVQHPEFKPHITLLRKVDHEGLLPACLPLELKIDRFALFHSTQIAGQLRYVPLNE